MNTEEAAEKLKKLAEEIVRELVDVPEEVKVTSTASEGGNTVVLTVKTANGETGKVIGRRGKNAEALRTLLEAIAAKNRQRVVLEIADRKLQEREGGR